MDAMAYSKVLGLKRHPFPVAPDDGHFYASAYILQIISEIVHGILARKGFMVLSGDVGVGKTTITRRILRILARQGVQTSLVFHTSLKDVDLLREINRDFGLQTETNGGAGLGDLLQQLNAFLLDQYAKGKNCAVIIDDAQNLDRQSLELVRMISNLEAHRQKLVQILLVGQTELVSALNAPAMRQMQSRIVIRKVVRSLSREELRDYILFKLHRAGNTGNIGLSRAALRRLYGYTQGNCRQVNLLMDRCLYAISHRGQNIIRRQVVTLAHADLHPEQRRYHMRALAASAAALTVMTMAIPELRLRIGPSAPVSEVANGRYYKIPQVPTNTSSEAVAGTAVSPGDVISHPDAGAAPNPAVAAFLSVYQLDDYSKDFQAALKSGHLETLAERIYAQRGYQLVRLDVIPERIRRQYGALAFSTGTDQAPNWFLFWRPKIRLRRFYPRYKGDEIYRLQRLMANIDYYRSEPDGIVGPRLVAAVQCFQSNSGLQATGFPDSVTLFLLCHQQEDALSWPKAT